MNNLLGNFANFKGGSAFPRDEQGNTTGSIPFMKVSDLSRGTGRWKVNDAANWLSDDQVMALKPTIAPEGATVFAKIGEGLRSERCRLLTRPTAIDNNMMAAVPTEACNPAFLYYLLQTVRLSSFAVGSALPYLKQSTLREIGVSVPPIEEQQAIADVLSALDEKIAANTRLVRTVDELSRALFTSMLNDSTSDVALSASAQFVNGKAFTKGATGTGRVVIRIAELNSGLGASTVYNDIDVPSQHLAQSGDLLFAWSGSLTLHRWYRPDGIINQHIFKVIPNAPYPIWLVYELTRHKLEEFKAIAANKATTMGHIQRMHLDEPVAIPPETTIQGNNDLMAALWNRGLAAQEEILSLESTRETLLTHLMTGEVRPEKD